MQADEADLEVSGDRELRAELNRLEDVLHSFIFLVAAGSESGAGADAHDGNENQGKNLLKHCLFPPKKILLFLPGGRPK